MHDANRSASLIRRRSSRPAPDLEKRFSLAPSLVAIGSATSSTYASSLGALVQFNSTASLDAASLIAAKSRGDVERHDVDSIMSRSTEAEDDDDPDAAALRAYAFNSRALPLLHLVVGILNNLQAVAWREWLIHGACEQQGLNPADQALLSGVVCALPWNLKIFIAFLSDVRSICGSRRVAYLLIGLFLQGGGWLFLGLVGDAAMLPTIAAQQFAVTMGQVCVGVICDALIVESVACERGAQVGKLQTTCQLTFAFGGLVGTVLSGVLPQFLGASSQTIFVARGAAALALLPLCATLLREAAPPARAAAAGGCARVKETARDVWATMSRLRVFFPLVFIFSFAMAPNSGDAFNTYLLQQTPLCATNATAGNTTTCVDARAAAAPGPIGDYCAGFDGDAAACATQWGGLDFDEATYAAIGLLGSVGSVLGNWLFRRFLLQAQWHCMFATTVVCACASSALQLLLMFRDPTDGVTLAERWHMPNVVFALGDDVVMATANQLLAMPILILMARLCPVGAEGTAYALVTSVQMVGGTVSGILAQQATRAFGVTNQNFARLWQLTLLTSVAKLVALPLLPLVPSSASLDAAQSDDRRSTAAGAVILALFVGGLAWALTQVAVSLAEGSV